MQKQKPIEKKKNANKGRSLLSSFALPSHFWLLLLPFHFKCFLLTSSSFQTKEKKNTMKKKTIEKKKMLKKKGTYLFSNRKKKKKT
jgi:hypothetical protein